MATRSAALAAFALAAAALSPTAIATTRVPPGVQPILDRYVEGTGGRAAFEAERTTRARGRIRSSGMSGTFEQWTMQPDKILTRLHLGPLKIQTGFDGTTGWRTDLNSKKVTILDGKDLEALKAEAWFENERWASADAGGAAFTLGTTSFRGAQKFRGLEIVPPTGPSRRLWFDTKTGRIDRIVSRRDQHEWQQWVSGWRRTGARHRWTTQSSQAPKDDDEGKENDPERSRWEERMTADSLWSNLELDPAMFSPPTLASKSVAWRKASGRISVPFRYGTRHVWIKASINGAAPADFLLDTGCSITAIDREYAESIGLMAEGNLVVQGVSGTGEGAFARVKSLRLGPTTATSVAVRDLKVGLIELGEGFEAVMWRKAAGLIGYDFLSHFVVEIDYDREIVTFHEPQGYAAPEGVEPIPMRLFSGIPVVQATLNDGCSGEFVVDVGNGFGVDVHGSMVRRCQLLGTVSGRKQVEVYSGGIGGAAVNWFCRLDKVKLGAHEWTEPIAGLSLGSSGLHGSKDYSGNIGNAVLERFKVTFDYERRKLYLEPGKRFERADRFSRSGIVLARFTDRVVPAQIIGGSAAYEAGIKLRDRVTSIDGRPAHHYTPEELDRLFVEGDEGKVHTVVIERDGVTKTVTMTLRDVL